MNDVQIAISPTENFVGYPQYQTQGSACLDLQAALPKDTPRLILHPGETKLIPCGFRVAIPPGWELQIRPRSGLALKHGVTVANAPGTIDSDYRGEVCVILKHTNSTGMFVVNRGDRIAQMSAHRTTKILWTFSQELEDTDRSSGGFGSTGV